MLDFGAIGDANHYNETDGKYYKDLVFTQLPTDNTGAFRQALLSASGHTLYIPSGRYMILGTLEVPSNTVIEGDGMELTHIYVGDGNVLDSIPFRDGTVKPIVITKSGSSNIQFRRFKLTGNWNLVDYESWGVAGILIKDTSVVKVIEVDVSWINMRRTLISSHQGWTITSTYADDVEYYKCRSEYGGYQNFGFFDFTTKGLMHECFSGMGRRTSTQVHRGCDDIVIRNNKIIQPKSVFVQEPHAALTVHGEDTEEAKNITIENNEIYVDEAYKASVQAFRESENLIVRGNKIYSNAQGVDIGDADNALVEDNRIVAVNEPYPDGDLHLGKYGVSLTLGTKNSTVRNNEIVGFDQMVYKDSTIGNSNDIYGNKDQIVSGIRKINLYVKQQGEVLRADSYAKDAGRVSKVDMYVNKP